VSYHTGWDVKPVSGQPGMSVSAFLARLAEAFPIAVFDPEGARQNALLRLDALQKLTFPVGEEVLASYRDAHPVDVFLADTDAEDRAALDFTVWPEKDGVVSGLQVYFGSEEHQREAAVLFARLADALGWEVEDITDEVS